MRASTILFDWDGTLCDSGAAGLRAFRGALAECGIAFTDAEYRAVYSPNWYQMYEAFALPRSLWRQADERWLFHYRDEQPGLVSGAAVVLSALRSRGVRVGIVSGGTRGRIEQELTRFRLTSTFAAIVCSEDVTHKKPHAEGLEKALAALSCPPEACWYVGDTPEDIQMGKNARVFTVGVLSAHVSGSRMAECRPHLLLNTIEDLPGALFSGPTSEPGASEYQLDS